MPDKPNVTVNRKDDVTLTITVTDVSGAAFDLTSCSLQMLVKENADDVDASAVITKTITEAPSATDGQILSPATNGVAQFVIQAADAAALGLLEDRIQYFLGIKLKTSAGKYHTVVDGRIDFAREIVASTSF